MQYVRLGSSGLQVSRIALGCMIFGVPDRGDNPLTLDEALTRTLIRSAVEVLGDVIANPRSAPDHSLTAVNRRAGRRAQFPIFDDAAEFEEKFAKGWVSDKALSELVDFLRPHQPAVDRRK